MVVVFPELSTEEEEEEEEEGDDEEGSNSSSDEFTDSIEEDDNKVTARSLAAVQVRTELIFSKFLLHICLFLRSLFLTFQLLRNELKANIMLCLNSPKAFGPESVTRDPVRGSVSHSTDVKQLEEEKQTLESQLEEISAQLEVYGYTSVAQMRSVLFFKLLSSFKVLQPESCATVDILPWSIFAVACQVCAAEAAAGEPSPEGESRASRSGRTWREQTAEPEESDMGGRGGGRRR